MFHNFTNRFHMGSFKKFFLICCQHLLSIYRHYYFNSHRESIPSGNELGMRKQFITSCHAIKQLRNDPTANTQSAIIRNKLSPSTDAWHQIYTNKKAHVSPDSPFHKHSRSGTFMLKCVTA